MEIDTTASDGPVVVTNNKRSVSLLEEETEEVCKPENALDFGFFSDFTVDCTRWYICDRIESCGFIYIHQETGRPLAITKTRDNEDQLNGYCFWFQFDLDRTEEINLPLSEKERISGFLSKLNNEYKLAGLWANSAVDEKEDTIIIEGEEEEEEENIIDPNESSDYRMHAVLYHSFLRSLKLTQAQPVRKKFNRVKRQNK